MRGRLFHFFRDESPDANTFFNNARGLPRLPLQQHAAGFTLGGPASPRKLIGTRRDTGEADTATNGDDVSTNGAPPDDAANTFFFVAYEFDAALDSTLIDTLVPVAENPRFTLACGA